MGYEEMTKELCFDGHGTNIIRLDKEQSKFLAIDQKINPFVMPFRDFGDGKIQDPELNRLARWCNRVCIRKSCSFEEYR